jgi:hypothetical protein
LGHGRLSSTEGFIRAHVFKIEKRRKTTEKVLRQNNTVQYSLPNFNDKLVQVCRSFFLKTLDIGERVIAYTLSRKPELGSHDCRGKISPGNIIPQTKQGQIRDHIN